MADSKNPQKKSAKDRKADRHTSSQLVRVNARLYKRIAEIAADGDRPAKRELEAAIWHWGDLTPEERSAARKKRKAAGGD
jgi:hypothetical protein